MTRLLLRGGRIAGVPGATALAVDDALPGSGVVYVGDDDGAAAYDGAEEVVDLAGALVTRGFVDSHVHTVRTGMALTGLDLTGLPTLTAALEALAAHAGARPDAALLLGQGWDETDWPEGRPPTAAELERAAPGRRVCLTRVDGHSAVVSAELAALVPDLAATPGATPDGRVERAAHHAVRDALETLVDDGQRLAAARAACVAMAAQGIVAFHENAAPHIGPEAEIPLVRQAAADAGLAVSVYWGQLAGPDSLALARRHDAAGLAGDLVADGAFGSRTAALREPYADAASGPGSGPAACGHAYVSAEEVAEHVVRCTEEGLQAGFHGIGDAALEIVREGLEAAERRLGTERVAAAGHRLEHVELPSPELVATLARLRVTASVQPMFDALWGGPDGMYAARLGERWRATNPFRDLHRAGVRLAFGSDAPVTQLGPWAAVRAAVHHHHPEQRLDVATALGAHTVADGEPGLAVWGLPADVALDERQLPRLDPDVALPVLQRLVPPPAPEGAA